MCFSMKSILYYLDREKWKKTKYHSKTKPVEGKVERSKVLVNFDLSGYSLTVYFDELDYEQESKKYGDGFEEVMYKKALERLIKDGFNLPDREMWYKVEPY